MGLFRDSTYDDGVMEGIIMGRVTARPQVVTVSEVPQGIIDKLHELQNELNATKRALDEERFARLGNRVHIAAADAVLNELAAKVGKPAVREAIKKVYAEAYYKRGKELGREKYLKNEDQGLLTEAFLNSSREIDDYS